MVYFYPNDLGWVTFYISNIKIIILQIVLAYLLDPMSGVVALGTGIVR